MSQFQVKKDEAQIPPIQFEEVSCCISCLSKDLKNKTSFKSKDNKVYTAVKCLNCGLVFATPQPILTPSAINEIYSNDYYSNYFGSSVDYLDKSRIDYYMKCYEKEYLIYESYVIKKEDRKVLDVGCGDGRFLEIFRKYGWNCLGLEPSNVSRAMAIKKGFTILDTPFLDIKNEVGLFDLIFIDNVIEHINNPRQFLTKAFSLLNANGVLVLKTPNSDSLLEKSETIMLNLLPSWASNGFMNIIKTYFKKGSGRVHRYGNLHPPVHLAIYNNQSITKALTNAGFENSNIHNFFISPHHKQWGIDQKKTGIIPNIQKSLHRLSNTLKKGEFLISISQKK